MESTLGQYMKVMAGAHPEFVMLAQVYNAFACQYRTCAVAGNALAGGHACYRIVDMLRTFLAPPVHYPREWLLHVGTGE